MLHTLEYAAIGIAAFALILYRQLRTTRVDLDSGPRTLVIFGVIGLVLAGQYLSQHAIAPLSVIALLLSLIVAAVLAWVRGRSVRIWADAAGIWWRRGTWLTLVLWLVAMGSHIGIDAGLSYLAGSANGAGLGNATIMLYLAVSLGLQRLVVASRIRARQADLAG